MSMKTKGTSARCAMSQKIVMIALNALTLSLALLGAPAHAEGSGQSGLYIAVPVYLYEKYSASGAQLGWQKGNWHFRLDLSVVDVAERSGDAFFANPSLGAFYSHEWEGKIRTYEGITVGLETGLHKSFEGQVYTLGAMMGIEWFVFGRQAFYFELGTGMGVLRKEGAFNGGTVLGGGMKYFL